MIISKTLNIGGVTVSSYPYNVFVLHNFYSAAEIKNSFDFAEASYPEAKMLRLNQGLVAPSIFAELPVFKKLLRVDDVTGLMGDLLGKPSMRETLHSDYHVNTLGGWHNDLGLEVGGYVKNPPEQYEIFKFGTFYSNNPEKVQLTTTQFRLGNKMFRPKVSIGDVLIFPIDITHRGYPGKMSWRVARKIDQILGRFVQSGTPHIQSFLRKQAGEDRRALFYTFGRDDKVLDEFERSNMKRADSQTQAYG